LLRVDGSIGEAQRERLAAFKTDRDQVAVVEALDALQQAADGTANVMPHIVKAVKSDASLGEIADCLRGVFGEYQEQVVI
jgi:methylmalonyl-CoA mutase N-terminal domain/subunit